MKSGKRAGRSNPTTSGATVRNKRGSAQRNTRGPPAKPSQSDDLQCIHYKDCSGCNLDHKLRQPPLYHTAKDYFKTTHQLDLDWHAGPIHGWRCRAKIAVRGTAKRPVLGLFREDSHVATPIPSCRVHHPAINQAIALISQLVTALRIPPYDESTGQGLLRYLQLTVAPQQRPPLPQHDTSSLVQVVLVLALPLRSPPTAAHQQCINLAQQLWLLGGPTAVTPRPLLHSVWLNFHPSPTSNTILGPDWSQQHGPRLLWLHHPSHSLAFLPGSFIQANYAAASLCAQAVARAIPPGSRVTELYAGVGALGLALAALNPPARLRLVEANPHCLEPFQAARARLPEELDVTYHVASAGDDPIQWLAGADVLVVDPPRRGLDAPLLDVLCSLPPPAAGGPPQPQAGVTTLGPGGRAAPSTPSAPYNPTLPPCTDDTFSSSAAPSRSLAHSRSAVSSRSLSPSPSGSPSAPPPSSLPFPSPASSSVAPPTLPSTPTPAQPYHTSNAHHCSEVGAKLGDLRLLVYVSCGFDAFQRDCSALVGSGRWRVVGARAFLFFPGTDSLETLAVFQRMPEG